MSASTPISRTCLAAKVLAILFLLIGSAVGDRPEKNAIRKRSLAVQGGGSAADGHNDKGTHGADGSSEREFSRTKHFTEAVEKVEEKRASTAVQAAAGAHKIDEHRGHLEQLRNQLNTVEESQKHFEEEFVKHMDKGEEHRLKPLTQHA